MELIKKALMRILLDNKHKFGWRVLATTMAGVIVFVTTYSLILPAITMDANTAETMAGFDGGTLLDDEAYAEDDYGADAADAGEWAGLDAGKRILGDSEDAGVPEEEDGGDLFDSLFDDSEPFYEDIEIADFDGDAAVDEEGVFDPVTGTIHTVIENKKDEDDGIEIRLTFEKPETIPSDAKLVPYEIEKDTWLFEQCEAGTQQTLDMYLENNETEVSCDYTSRYFQFNLMSGDEKFEAPGKVIVEMTFEKPFSADDVQVAEFAEKNASDFSKEGKHLPVLLDQKELEKEDKFLCEKDEYGRVYRLTFETEDLSVLGIENGIERVEELTETTEGIEATETTEAESDSHIAIEGEEEREEETEFVTEQAAEVQDTEAEQLEAVADETMDAAEELQAEQETEFDTEGETEELEEITEAETETEVYPAQSFDMSTGYVSVRVYAPEGAFPEGTTMSVEDVDDADTLQTIEAETATEKTTVKQIHAVDITFTDRTGREIEPACPIRVEMTPVEAPATDNAVVVHVDDAGNAEKVETVEAVGSGDFEETVAETEAEPVSEVALLGEEVSVIVPDSTTVAFETDAFSVYALVYTVDFHWEVDGRFFEISIPGGGFLSFEKLVEILGIAKSDTNDSPAENQETKNDASVTQEDTQISNEIQKNEETAATSEDDVQTDKEEEDIDEAVPTSDDSQISEKSNKNNVFALALNDVLVSEETKKFVAEVENIEFSNPELLWVDKVEEECTVSELKEDNDLEVQYSGELTEEQIDEINAQTVETGDWALISLQQFFTEETLIVTMTNGDTWTIRVTDAVAETPVRNPGTVNTVDTYADGVKMWLFNYDIDGNLDDSSNKIKFNNNNHTGKVGFNNSLANDGINSYSGLKFLGWGSDSDYNITSNVDINNFTGLDESGQGKGNKIKALQGIVQNSLDANGYPVLNSQYNSTSLAYLFNPTANTNDRVVYGGENGNVTNLFRKENGYYKFDSNQHYAQFDGDHTFTVYDTTIPQTNKNGNKHNPTRAVGFFPFNSYNNMLGIWDTNQKMGHTPFT